MSCTAAVDSCVATISEVVGEIDFNYIWKGAIDDKRSEAAMEKKKQQGYLEWSSEIFLFTF
jgi:sulfate adenylyltransferase subunit 2